MGLFSKWTAAKSKRVSHSLVTLDAHALGMACAGRERVARSSSGGSRESRRLQPTGGSSNRGSRTRTFRRSQWRGVPVCVSMCKNVNKRRQRRPGRRQLTLQISFSILVNSHITLFFIFCLTVFQILILHKIKPNIGFLVSGAYAIFRLLEVEYLKMVFEKI
jgi:hypothetical protein